MKDRAYLHTKRTHTPPPDHFPTPMKREADPLTCANATFLQGALCASQRRTEARHRQATVTPEGLTGGGMDGGRGGGGAVCGAAVGATAAVSPPVGSCTTSSSNFIYPPTYCERCFDQCGMIAEYFGKIENT